MKSIASRLREIADDLDFKVRGYDRSKTFIADGHARGLRALADELDQKAGQIPQVYLHSELAMRDLKALAASIGDTQ